MRKVFLIKKQINIHYMSRQYFWRIKGYTVHLINIFFPNLLQLYNATWSILPPPQCLLCKYRNTLDSQEFLRNTEVFGGQGKGKRKGKAVTMMCTITSWSKTCDLTTCIWYQDGCSKLRGLNHDSMHIFSHFPPTL